MFLRKQLRGATKAARPHKNFSTSIHSNAPSSQENKSRLFGDRELKPQPLIKSSHKVGKDYKRPTVQHLSKSETEAFANLMTTLLPNLPPDSILSTLSERSQSRFSRLTGSMHNQIKERRAEIARDRAAGMTPEDMDELEKYKLEIRNLGTESQVLMWAESKVFAPEAKEVMSRLGWELVHFLFITMRDRFKSYQGAKYIFHLASTTSVEVYLAVCTPQLYNLYLDLLTTQPLPPFNEILMTIKNMIDMGFPVAAGVAQDVERVSKFVRVDMAHNMGILSEKDKENFRQMESLLQWKRHLSKKQTLARGGKYERSEARSSLETRSKAEQLDHLEQRHKNPEDQDQSRDRYGRSEYRARQPNDRYESEKSYGRSGFNGKQRPKQSSDQYFQNRTNDGVDFVGGQKLQQPVGENQGSSGQTQLPEMYVSNTVVTPRNNEMSGSPSAEALEEDLVAQTLESLGDGPAPWLPSPTEINEMLNSSEKEDNANNIISQSEIIINTFSGQKDASWLPSAKEMNEIFGSPEVKEGNNTNREINQPINTVATPKKDDLTGFPSAEASEEKFVTPNLEKLGDGPVPCGDDGLSWVEEQEVIDQMDERTR